ncbi:hypothetical protein ABZP36_007611 [Zizania latifolia]
MASHISAGVFYLFAKIHHAHILVTISSRKLNFASATEKWGLHTRVHGAHLMLEKSLHFLHYVRVEANHRTPCSVCCPFRYIACMINITKGSRSPNTHLTLQRFPVSCWHTKQ